MAWPLCSGTVDWTYGLSLKAAIPDEATPSSVQCSEAYSGSGQPVRGSLTHDSGAPPITS